MHLFVFSVSINYDTDLRRNIEQVNLRYLLPLILLVTAEAILLNTVGRNPGYYAKSKFKSDPGEAVSEIIETKELLIEMNPVENKKANKRYLRSKD